MRITVLEYHHNKRLFQDLCPQFLTAQGNCVECEGREDAKEFANVRSAMKVLTYTDQEILQILTILAALLHLGNVSYKGKIEFRVILIQNYTDSPVDIPYWLNHLVVGTVWNHIMARPRIQKLFKNIFNYFALLSVRYSVYLLKIVVLNEKFYHMAIWIRPNCKLFVFGTPLDIVSYIFTQHFAVISMPS